MDMGTELGMLSTTTQLDFMLIMAAMETDLCQARWEALAWVPHTGEVIQVGPKSHHNLEFLDRISRLVYT